MDKRKKHIDRDAERAFRDQFYQDIQNGTLSIAQAVKAMRKMSRLTQAEFAAHRGISLPTLKHIERGTGSPKTATLVKIADIFGLDVGFVVRKREC